MQDDGESAIAKTQRVQRFVFDRLMTAGPQTSQIAICLAAVFSKTRFLVEVQTIHGVRPGGHLVFLIIDGVFLRADAPAGAGKKGVKQPPSLALSLAVALPAGGEPHSEPVEAQLVEREPLVVQQVPDSTIIREGMAQEGVTEAAPEGLQSWLCCR
ncbi:unnamed protein product [Polarella glacialis]|uniref:Uncharacterized protein n=1 Tax=Polarella glacialis TaxID=89957 RepID=A0A813JR62_POLGL|nr:unnamed protein product [Polarella glacialis]